MKAKDVKELLEPIPTEDFIINKYSNGKDKCCAIGHIVRLSSKDPNDYSHENCTLNQIDMDDRIFKFIRNDTLLYNYLFNELYEDISKVNNIKVKTYDQEQPKERVMAMLEDMINNVEFNKNNQQYE